MLPFLAAERASSRASCGAFTIGISMMNPTDQQHTYVVAGRAHMKRTSGERLSRIQAPIILPSSLVPAPTLFAPEVSSCTLPSRISLCPRADGLRHVIPHSDNHETVRQCAICSVHLCREASWKEGVGAEATADACVCIMTGNSYLLSHGHEWPRG